MKRLTRWLIAGAVCTLLLGCSTAFAAEDINVQLNGETLAFTDAAPQVKAQRTFLPFRAVFEAMGAQVSYEGVDITATRNGRTVTMNLDSTTVTVTENGEATTFEMDVGPYVDNATWRTYVPVRFAAQAFGCAVGWDQDAYTALIVDVDKLLEEAVADKSFTYMEKLLEHSKKYNQGIWDTDLTMDGAVMVGHDGVFVDVPLALTATGTTEGQSKLDVTMNVTVDLSDVVALTQATEELPEAEAAVLDALAQEGIGLQMRGDLDQGTIYLTLSGKTLEELAGMPVGVWFSMDMNTLYERMGIDYAQLMEMSRNPDYQALVKGLLGAVELDDAATNYAQIKAVVEQVALFCSDGAFVGSGDDYTTTLFLADDKTSTEFGLSVTLTIKDDAVVGYTMGMSMGADGMVFDIEMAQDEKDTLSGKLNMDIAPGAGTQMHMNMDISGSYREGTGSPAVQPPAGSVAIPLDAVLGGVPLG